MKISAIITGATGMVGEGVLLECLAHPEVERVLMVNRKSFSVSHPKLEEVIVPDFFDLEDVKEKFKGYNACFFCAGVSSIGMTESAYRQVTYDLTMHFARTLSSVQPSLTFIYVSGSHTDSSEHGKIMWARVKGKTENDLLKLPFQAVYNFRPGFMKPTPGQRNIKSYYKFINWMFPVFKAFMPGLVSTMGEVGMAMINIVLKGYPRPTIEVSDIKTLAANG
jgi:uncharacterized protein YbjT (DUF2867 family)